MKRREFIKLLGGAAAWPMAARAQQGERMRRIGVLMAYAESDLEGQANIAAFREGLKKLGWEEGRNILIDFRWAALDVEAMQRSATELVALKPDLIFSNNTPTTAAILQQTRTIPIVFAIAAGSAAASSRASRGREATSRVLPLSRVRWVASGWSCSRRSRLASTGSPSCSTRQRRHMPNTLKPLAATA
jgi:ABC-type uncharacterized transport system substrate-binding protein